MFYVLLFHLFIFCYYVPLCMGVDHMVDRGTCPLLFEVGDVMCLSPLIFRGRNPYYVVDLLNNDCFSSSIKHNNAQ